MRWNSVRYKFAILVICIGILSHPFTLQANINVSAENAILMDQSSGRILFEKNADQKKLIASITKIMTAIVAIESGDLSEKVKISEKATRVEGSSIYLKQEDSFTLEELVYGLMLRSGNDAATAISEQVGGSQEGFVYLMNEKAKWLGMTNTNFENPHGLDGDTHHSTAKDMAILMQYAMTNETFQKVSGTEVYKANDRDYAWRNKNKLLTAYYEYCTGGKTGYTKAAGRTLVSTAEKNGHTLIAVTLNAPDDWQDHIQLFEWGFENFDKEQIQDKGEFQYSIKAADEEITGQIIRPIFYPLTEEEKQAIQAKTYLYKNVENHDHHIGKKFFYLNGEKIAETNIHAKINNSYTEAGNGFWTSVTRLFQQVLGDPSD
ncbi:D-alanyl-D-alanine carboxypeptidase family protein [Gracilibacillus sp. YIM 98692]|uniref:D-alanyl-D-alanine carboxypeptidase family protein n=1 Tax=Gracilibacillus sp. YIM 98692 TaxID=2663532 RepID=UPI0013D697B2|nr:D-alanyl-D-alanine carboxypeptidase family protein [Gracilibacillus sp. YIM 98692]